MKTLTLTAGLVFLLALSASAYICGDANGDQAVNVGDPVYIISYIFKGGPEPQPLEAGDANVDQMVNIGDAVCLINYIFKSGPPPCPEPTGSVVGQSDCLVLKSSLDNSQYQECVDYSYDGIGVLTLTHRNDFFNCCMTTVSTEVSLADQVLSIVEIEYLEYGPCDCMCFFDIDFEINDLPPGIYTIYLDNPYIPFGEWDPRQDIEFTVDLTSATSGSYCVER